MRLLTLIAAALTIMAHGTTPVTLAQDLDLKKLAGTWQGEIQVGDKTHPLTVVIKENGSFKLSVPTTNHESEGKISISKGKISWHNYTTRVGGVMTYAEEGDKRFLKGSRDDGSRPFTWWSEKK